jgi:predicted DCC family thiol-disulfide oxidoreductase YuxK
MTRMSTGSTRPLMLYDGDCALCAGSVKFALAHEREPTLLFASLQSERGQAELRRFGRSTTVFDTFVIVEGDVCYVRMRASQRLGYHMGGVWRFLSRLAYVVPLPIGDLFYSFVFRNRIRWFGRATCRVADAETRTRFVDDVAIGASPALARA